MKRLILLSIWVLSVFIISCENSMQNTNMPNPASAYCEKNGGKLEIRTAEDGSQAGYCILEDGKECDEWAFYRGECLKKCDTCPMIAQPSPNFCKDGKIVAGEKDECGCVGTPKCEAVACTEDAKVCPDGTAVGRVAPDCEFAPCSGEI